MSILDTATPPTAKGATKVTLLGSDAEYSPKGHIYSTLKAIREHGASGLTCAGIAKATGIKGTVVSQQMAPSEPIIKHALAEPKAGTKPQVFFITERGVRYLNLRENGFSGTKAIDAINGVPGESVFTAAAKPKTTASKPVKAANPKQDRLFAITNTGELMIFKGTEQTFLTKAETETLADFLASRA